MGVFPATDPVLNLASKLGFEVLYYTPRQTPWHLFLILLVHNLIFLVGLALWLYGVSRLNKGPLRTVGAWMGLAAQLLEPVWYGRTGLGIIDYGMPAYGFLGFLHIVDVFFLRPIEEVHSWSFARTICQIFAFVNEHSTTSNPRIENIKAVRLCGLKYLMVNMLIYAAPPPEVMAQVKPYSVAYFGYHGIVGLCILGVLGFFIEFVIRLIGVVFGIEMNPMFRNPNGASNIREFWARWNMVIKDGLSRVFFHFKAPPTSKKASSSSVQGSATARKGAIPPTLRHRLAKADYLDETDASEGDSRPPSPELKARKLSSQTARKRSSFLPKALAALGTFVASGLFHEYMNHLAFNGANGQTVVFFVAHALATISYSFAARHFSRQLAWCPRWLGVLAVNIFAFSTTPMFTGPFARVGFFEDLKSFGVFGPVRGFIWIFGDGYGGHGRS